MIKKRFIAGAVCPRCAKMDKIVTYKEGDNEYRECVACGFLDEMNFAVTAHEPETRVNKSPAKKIKLIETRAVETQVLQFPPKKNN